MPTMTYGPAQPCGPALPMTVAGVVPLVLGMKGRCTAALGIVDDDACRRLHTAVGF
jgi:hypothetical protein